MADPVLWPLDDHTRAKHRVLRAYLNAWIPVMAQQALKVSADPRLLVVDGFAGPGEYEQGEPGSPLIALNALLEHSARQRFDRVKFYFFFIEHDGRRVEHLRHLVDQRILPANVDVQTVEGEFETTFGRLVDGLRRQSHHPIPTFAFIDPFGYSKAPMSLSGRFLDFHQSEALIFLPLSFVCRFLDREGQERALDSLFDTEKWREASGLQGVDRAQFLISLFESQIRSKGQARYARSFELHTQDGQDYRLVFATGHERGLELMKEAMWTVDPVKGTKYVAHTDTGQAVLFAPTADTALLLNDLRRIFGMRWFTIEEAERETLHHTLFLPRRHLKRLTLKPAEAAGVIEVARPARGPAGSFTPRTRMRFL